MRALLSIVAVLALSGPAFAGHAAGTPPGQAAANGSDVNGDGTTNGKDYAPGQSAGADAGEDLNDNGRTNGKDYAPGQIPRRS